METNIITEKKFRLPKEFATRWLAALRSGKYDQANERLVDISGHKWSYCCLGLAEYIEGQDPQLMYDREWTLPNCIILETDYESKVPTELQTEFYMRDTTRTQSLAGTLAHMNDTGSTFEQIADWIEQNVELYEPENTQVEGQ